MIKTILTEYGLGWAINRLLYSAKLKMLSAVPATENIFEKRVQVKKIDLFNLNVARIRTFLLKLSLEKQYKILAIADKAINGIITGFSSIELDYGNPINWHYSPITREESVRTAKWYRIPDFEVKRGDIKIIWEASRLTHFLYFARAYLITGNVKYYCAFSEQLKHWLKDNPYPYGANYKCGQECTLRMINALIAYTVFNQLTTDEDENNIFLLVEVCYKKVLANFFYAHKCIKNNHTFSEICGLIIGAWCCNDKEGLTKAYGLLDKETEGEFLLDGGYTQYSFNYQRFTLQIFECIYKIGEKTGISISAKSKELLKSSALLMYQAQDITGDVPNYGSNDGALIFPLTVCDYRDFRSVLNTIYALTTGERLYDAGDYDEELLWFGDGKEIPVAEIERKSTSFDMSGFYTLRHDGGFLMTYLQSFKARPSHMDGLHIDLWHKGKNIFCDSGTYSYASELVKEISTTVGHNTAKVTGIEQMNKRGAFLIYDWAECKDVKHAEDSFSGTLISKNGYEHSRKIQRTVQGYKIDDEVRGNGVHCEFYFHTPYEVKSVLNGFEVFDDGKKLCVVKIESGNIEIRKAYRSLYYLRKEEINCVVVKRSMSNKCNLKFEINLN
ncbi:heparinase II/III domain-containing protein [Desulfosporosinus lacus]|uniref:Heparinase II/III N-terminus n=1 Tax=Desulfosporosinus lacus DSM 15449 TaxID=1121420 RepID=A0A1M5SJF6_9FIRM|nr:heparinase II/III family protein [Desulfosporosinus lacus]SHH38621.1 Heparinase II/III N-terminus [Desulfosporosinus lacus DSM 15449]